MRIAGVQTGQNKGEVIELGPDKKVIEAVILGATTSDAFKGFSVTVADIRVDSSSFQVAGEKLKKKWAHNRYRAEGRCNVWLRDLGKDILHEARPCEWTVEFHDVLDEYGQPDLKVDIFTAEDPRPH